MPSHENPYARGLSELRRGSITELLFLFDCATLEPSQLRPIADHLGLTVQAISHSFRQLQKRGLVEVREGRYLPTIKGVEWLHGTLGLLADDVKAHLDRLHVIRSCRAIAAADLSPGQPVSLELEEGLLSASPARDGASRGIVSKGGSKGSLVEVSRLEGIVPIHSAGVSIRTITDDDLEDPRIRERLTRTLQENSRALLAARGLAAFHLLRRATDRPITRFAVAESCSEAASIGVPSTVFVLEQELPGFLAEFAKPNPPALDVRPIAKNARHR